MVCNINRRCFSNINEVKKDRKAIAILLDINYYNKRASSDIITDIDLPEEEVRDLLLELDKHTFIRPNPHRNVNDINYVLAEKGQFLINELKARNPELFKELELTKEPKLPQFIESQSLSSIQ